jgi:hypothetical protein
VQGAVEYLVQNVFILVIQKERRYFPWFINTKKINKINILIKKLTK